MKKTIAILLILVIGMVGVFAEDWTPDNPGGVGKNKADLKLQTTITEKYGLIIADRSVVKGSKGENLGDYSTMDQYADFIGASGLISDAVSELTFTTGADLKKNIYVNFMTNMPNKATVTTTATPLISDVKDDEDNVVIMPYTVKVGNGNAVTVDSASGVSLTFYQEVTTSRALRLGSTAVEIEIAQSTWDLAATGDYEAIWTINLLID